MPHIYQGADGLFAFAVGLWTINAGKLLTDTVLPASFAESMVVSSFKFLIAIGISAVELIRTLGNDTEVNKFAWVRLVIALGFTLERFLACSTLARRFSTS